MQRVSLLISPEPRQPREPRLFHIHPRKMRKKLIRKAERSISTLPLPFTTFRDCFPLSWIISIPPCKGVPRTTEKFALHPVLPLSSSPFFIAALKLILTPEKCRKFRGKNFWPRKFLFFFAMCIGMDETHNKNRIKHKDPGGDRRAETSILTNKFLSRRLQENYTGLGSPSCRAQSRNSKLQSKLMGSYGCPEVGSISCPYTVPKCERNLYTWGNIT